jgi:triphosphatase
MLEVELKFQISETRRNALLKAIDPKKSEIIHLQAKYYDTPDRLLSQQGAALRQRLEGTRWIQTLKAATKSHLQRFEDNIDLGEQAEAPSLDLKTYENKPEAFAILQNALGDRIEHLQLQFETDIQRTTRLINCEDAEIEISLDVGEGKTRYL